MIRRVDRGPRLELFRAAGEWVCLASGFERQPVSPETLALLVNTRAAFDRMALARQEIEARQAAHWILTHLSCVSIQRMCSSTYSRRMPRGVN